MQHVCITTTAVTAAYSEWGGQRIFMNEKNTMTILDKNRIEIHVRVCLVYKQKVYQNPYLPKQFFFK